MKPKPLNNLPALCLIIILLLLLLPGILGFLAKPVILRAIELNNLNTPINIQLSDYQQHWFYSELSLTFSIESSDYIDFDEEFEEDFATDDTEDQVQLTLELKHGPLTFINGKAGLGFFYLYGEYHTGNHAASPPITENIETPAPNIIGYVRAGFWGGAQTNINIDPSHWLPEHLAHLEDINANSNQKLSPVILTFESDFQFEDIQYRLFWEGSAQGNTQNRLSNLFLEGNYHREDDQHWQGFSKIGVGEIFLPELNIHLQKLSTRLDNRISIDESASLTDLNWQWNIEKALYQEHDWQAATADIELDNIDLQALNTLMDTGQKAYLEFDSLFDEYAQLEYQAALQTLIPELLSDGAEVDIKRLQAIEHHTLSSDVQPIKTHHQISGNLAFADLADYQDDDLLALLAQTQGNIKLEKEHTFEKQGKLSNQQVSNVIRINRSIITLDGQSYDWPSLMKQL